MKPAKRGGHFADSMLPKLDPASNVPAVTPYPPPRPSAEPSLLYRKLRGGGRRRR
jgi:hypothetical protein